MNSPVEKIKEKLSIVDVISSYLKIEKAGKNYKAKCPFHNEKTPSFSISPDRGIYYCFGCGAKGDIFSFVEHFEGTNFLGSLKILAERAGIELSSYRNKEKDKTSIYYEIIEEATSFFEEILSRNIEVKNYLLGRGLNNLSIKSFRIGFAPESWSSTIEYLVKKGFKKEDMEAVGLIKRKDDRFYDRFRGRIMFPISDSSGRVIAFSGRIFKKYNNSGIEEAKYINSPDTPLFNKSNILFGLDKAKSTIRSRDYTIVVEGQMDLILSHQAGFSNTVAVSGTAFSDSVIDNESKTNNLGLVKRLSSNIIFAYDGDDAGIRAVSRSAMIALSFDMQVKVAVFPKGKDPADIISKEGYKEWEKIIKNRVDIISFHLNKIKEDNLSKELVRKQVEEKIFPFLFMISSSMKKSNYIKEIDEKLSISESATMEDYKNYERKQNLNNKNLKDNKKVEAKGINSRRSILERKLFGIFFWKIENVEKSKEIEKMKLSFEKNIGSEKFKKILSFYEPISDSLSFEAEMWYCDKIDILFKDTKEIILNLEEEILNEESYSLLLKIKEKEKNKDKEGMNFDLLARQKILEKIEDIKNSRSK